MQERPLSTKQIQEAEYEVLKRFSSYCDEHELRYYLCGGTLLGAIRHNGFIPWDDDIDVMMPRPDFMRFLEFSRKHMQLMTIIIIKILQSRDCCVESTI